MKSISKHWKLCSYSQGERQAYPAEIDKKNAPKDFFRGVFHFIIDESSINVLQLDG